MPIHPFNPTPTLQQPICQQIPLALLSKCIQNLDFFFYYLIIILLIQDIIFS